MWKEVIIAIIVIIVTAIIVIYEKWSALPGHKASKLQIIFMGIK